LTKEERLDMICLNFRIFCRRMYTIIDIWCLKNTWAYRTHQVICSSERYGEYLQKTVFLNIDSIVFNLSRDIWYKDEYEKALETKTLDIILKENPQISLNVIRAFILRKRYNLNLSMKLKDFIMDYMINTHEYLDVLMKIQISHYGYLALDEGALKHEIDKTIFT
jgi:hypothetical protein